MPVTRKTSNPISEIPPVSRVRAVAMRKRSTVAERKLWSALRRKQLSNKFRRQHPFGPYILDFYAWEAQLVIEVDGDSHADAAGLMHDQLRDRFLSRHGLTVKRYTNSDVLKNLESVVNDIGAWLNSEPPYNPPLEGGMGFGDLSP